MLFVHHRQPQPFEFDPVVYQGVRPHDYARPAACRALKIRARIAAFQHGYFDSHPLCMAHYEAGVLLGENLSGSHKSRLIAGIKRLHYRLKRDNGFAASHIALKKHIHPVGAFHPLPYQGNGVFLRGGKFKRGGAGETLAHAAV